jgi:fructose/tagatose bisphosphate aldolase
MSESYALATAKSRDDSLMLPSPEEYAAMLDGAAAGRYAFPAINVTSSQTLNAAMRGFAEAGSDGIVQVTVGGARYISGSAKDGLIGARAFAALGRELAGRYPVAIALHTDHCPPGDADSFLRPLLADSRERAARHERPLFNSHMFDGSTLPLADNLRLSAELLDQCRELGVVLEIECGIVGGEEDGIGGEGTTSARLYTTPEELLQVAGHWALEIAGATCWRRRSATSTASTRPGTSSCAPRSWPTARRRSTSRTPARAFSTSFMARVGRPRRNSAPRSTTAS